MTPVELHRRFGENYWESEPELHNIIVCSGKQGKYFIYNAMHTAKRKYDAYYRPHLGCIMWRRLELAA